MGGVLALLACVSLPLTPLFAQTPATAPGPRPRVTDVELDDDAVLHVELVDADGTKHTQSVPASLLADVVTKLSGLNPPAPAATPPTAPEGPRHGGWMRGNLYSPSTHLRYDVYLVADSLVQIRYDAPDGAHVANLPATVFTSTYDMYDRLAQGVNNKFEVLQKESHVWVSLARSFNLWYLFSVVGVVVFGGVLLVFRSKIRRVQRERDELSASRRRLVEAREAERRHLSAELHDGPVQELQRIIRSDLGPLARAVDDEQMLKHVEGARTTLQDVSGEIRSICKRLIPPVLVHFGLDRALRAHAEEFQAEHDLPVSLDLAEEDKQLPLYLRLALFRICQEALRNVAHHARASSVAVTLALDESTVTLTIRDDGNGFTPPNRLILLENEGHLGLSGIAERVEAIKGRLTLRSAPGRGTSIKVTAPIPAE